MYIRNVPVLLHEISQHIPPMYEISVDYFACNTLGMFFMFFFSISFGLSILRNINRYTVCDLVAFWNYVVVKGMLV